METITENYVRELIKKRPDEMHKGQAGRVLVIAGSKGMAGACVLALKGALYSGAGLVKAATSAEIRDIVQISVIEAMCIDRSDIDYSQHDAVAAGPGMGCDEKSYRIVEDLLLSFKGPVVLDADAISCLCDYAKAPAPDPQYPSDLPKIPAEMTSIIPDIIKRRKGVTVITPHPGEADRLLKALGEHGYRELGREKTAAVLAERTGAIVVLKGKRTVIAAANGNAYNAASGDTATDMYVNTSGNPGMATGGSGDVLTGITVSLLAQALAGARANEQLNSSEYMCANPIEAVAAAVFLHGLAGDIAAGEIGEYGMTSADIADAVPAAFKEITGR